MRIFLTLFVLAAAGAAIYWFMVRPLRKQWEEYRRLHSTLTAVDATLWFRIKMSMKGLRTILFNYLIIITSATLTALELIGSTSIVELLPAIDLGPVHVTPGQYIMLLNTLCGWINVRLRMVTNTAVGSPVETAEAVVEVPTVQGKPDVAIVSQGVEVVAVADTEKERGVLYAPTEAPTVAEVVKASDAGVAVVVKAKEAA